MATASEKNQFIAETGVRHFMSHYLRKILLGFWEMRNWGLICQDFRAAGEMLPLVNGFLKVLTGRGHSKM